MTGVLTRYVMTRLLLAMALVSVLLVGLYTLIELIREARALTGDYGAVQMLWYLLQTLPRRVYDIFPFAALIGTLMGLGGLAANNELVAMRSAGFDRGQLTTRALASVGLCLVVLIAVSELAVPGLEAGARADRQQARTGQAQLSGSGALWLRDGDAILRISHAAWVDGDRLEFGDLTVYTLDARMQPRAITRAGRGRHTGESWLLSEVSARRLDGEPVLDRPDPLRIESGLSPELLGASVERPRILGMRDLVGMKRFLRANELDAEAYEQAFWGRLAFPFNVLAMVLISLPLIFLNPVQRGRGINLFAGVAVGLGFFVTTRLVQGVAQLAPVPLWLTSFLPALLIGLLAVFLMRRA